MIVSAKYIIKRFLSDFCESNPCRHNGICNNHDDGHNCTCPAGYEGYNCENGK